MLLHILPTKLDIQHFISLLLWSGAASKVRKPVIPAKEGTHKSMFIMDICTTCTRFNRFHRYDINETFLHF